MMLKFFILTFILLSLSVSCLAGNKIYVMDRSFVNVIEDDQKKEKIISSYDKMVSPSELDSCGTVIEIIMGTAGVSYSAGACNLIHEDGKTEQIRFCGETGKKIYTLEPYHEAHPYQDKEITDLINFFQKECYI